MAYSINSKVTISGLNSRADLNDQIATVLSESTGSNGMPRYVVQLQRSGEKISLAPKNLVPIASTEDSGGGGFPGMPGGMPANMAGLMEKLPTWFKEKLARGEKPDLDDLKRLLGIDVTPTQIGVIVGSFFLLYFKLGLIKGLIITAFFSFVYFSSVKTYSRSGGGLAGIKAGLESVSTSIVNIVRSRFGYELTKTQANLILGGTFVAIVGLVVQSFLLSVRPTSASANLGGNGYYDEDDLEDYPSQSSQSMTSQLQDAYNQGYLDGSDGAEKKTMSYDPPRMPPRKKFNFQASTPPGPPPSSGSSFGIGQVMNIGYLAKNVYDLGGKPFNAMNIPTNFALMGNMQKMFMAFMALRIFGLSPI
mmetsp:Transcript_24766/g.32251  ORF Transcript_24766/g.32251 Transcript_24766/m.32251 type:complete len:363 (+) Transcript_24766:22-1110(+)